MKTIKVLGTGCPTCQRLLNDVNTLIVKHNWQARVEYINDIATILSYNVLSTPALIVDEKVIMIGYPGMAKVEAVLSKVLAI